MLVNNYNNEWRVFFTMNNTTYSVKKNEIESKWYIIDAANKPLGRVATEAAKLLRGKHKPTFTPNIDVGDHVIVLNCDQVILTGNKLNQKMYRHHSGYIGGMKEVSAKDMMANNPEKAMMLAIKGMLPHTKLGAAQLKKLRVYAGSEHENAAQKPEAWNF
jgi:large subunit ribosomal protein L13